MAVIENAATSPAALAAWRKSLRGMDRAELLAQQLVQRGAEHVLTALQQVGVTPENCAAMLTSLREGLIEIHGVAAERGIQLTDYSAPEAATKEVKP
jgi:non-ribosomal peptide synthetase component E (peptide arylation enzyme)